MRTLVAVLPVVIAATVACAETFETVPVADTYIWANYADRNYGASRHLAVGSASNRYNDDRFQTLIRWELPGDLRGSRVTSATVTLSIRGCRPGAGTIDVYLVTGAWSEKATWKHSDGERPWPKGYGALGATTGEALAHADVPEVPYNTGGELPTGETVTFDVTPIAERWAAGRANHGLLFRMAHVQYPQCNMSCYSRQMTGPDHGELPPRFVIDYEPK